VAQTEALRALEDPGCPVCRVGAWTDERTIHALVTEHYTDGHVIAAVGDALGFCPAHVRRLARRLEAPYVLRLLYAEATRVALSRLRSPHALHRPAPCPVCESRGRSERATLRMLLHALARPSFAAAYSRHGGLCVPHAFAGLAEADPRRATTVIEALHGRLAHNTEHSQPLLDLAGEDTDRAARRWAMAGLPPVPEDSDRPTITAFRERLELATCPACLVGGWMERRYLTWLNAESATNPNGLRADGIWLCPRHLWDFVTEASDRTAWAVEYHGGRLRAEIDQRRGLIRSPTRGLLMWWLRDRGATRRAVAPLVRQRRCSACLAVETAERCELDLVVTGLSDRPTRVAYHESHGLCFRHAMARPNSTVHDVLKARLGVLVWELDEGGRKSAWSTRHEIHGDEATAWLRAPVQLDGHAFLGAPPPVGKTSGTGGD
jgi:hypothetical protein